jgi:hypothetical protein
LERSAGRAQARGGFAAAAAFLERSAALTPSPGRRAERALAAAHAKYQAGAFDAALGLLAAAEAGPLDELQRARSDLLRGQIAFASSRGSDAPPLLLKAARRFEPLDLRLARETYLQALSAALFASSLASAADLQEVAEAASARISAPRGPAAGRHSCADNGGLPGGRGDTQAGGERLPRRGHLLGGRAALAVASLPFRRADLGLRQLAGIG